jgi:methyltransferase (TIGR00027 family)
VDPRRHSITALAASLFRAVHTRRDQPALLDDPYGDRLVTDAERALMLERLLLVVSPTDRRRIETITDLARAVDAAIQAGPAYGAVVVRARWAEDRLARALARGVRQYVLVGAGMDTFALRAPALEPALQIFEVDHPATQAMKQERFAHAGLRLPANVHFVAANLEQESVADALSRAAYRPRELAFFACLGITPYLTRETNLAMLGAAARCAPAGSELVFDYLDQDAFAPDRASEETKRLAAERAQTEEPWVSGFDPRALADDLAHVGLTLDEDLDPARVAARYLANRSDGLRIAAAHWRLAAAHVT